METTFTGVLRVLQHVDVLGFACYISQEHQHGDRVSGGYARTSAQAKIRKSSDESDRLRGNRFP